MFQTLLTRVEATASGSAALKLATDFAHTHRARLIGVSGRRPLTDDPSFFADGSLLQQMAAQQEAEVVEAGERFKAITHALGPQAAFHIRMTEPATALATEAAGADLILIGLSADSEERSTALASEVVMTTGLPVLAVPTDVRRISLGAIVIAWRNTPEAHRAITAALPLLKAAGVVELIAVDEGFNQAEAWEGLHAAKARLEANGVTARADLLNRKDTVADTLLDAARRFDAEMIVLGAYGHSRAREWLLGGVTRELLLQTTIPLLLVH